MPQKKSLKITFQGFFYNKYKDRDSSKKPLKLKDVRLMIQDMYHCESIDDLEADDIISMYQFKRT